MTTLHNNGKDEIQAALDAVGGEQRVRLLGPFHIAHDDAGLDGGVVLTEVSANSWLMGVGVVATEDHGGVGTVNFQIGLANPELTEVLTGFKCKTMGRIQMSGYTTVLGLAIGEPGEVEIVPVGMGESDGVLCALVSFSDVQPTGEWDIYALIAEPVE